MTDLLSHILPTAIIFLPLLGAAAAVALGDKRARWAGLITSAVILLLTCAMAGLFDRGRAGAYAYAEAGGTMQMVVRAEWIPAFHIQYLVGVDGLSLPLLLMSSIVFLLAGVAAWENINFGRGFWACVLLLQTAVAGSFLALDLFLFFVFFEMSLLPMYFLIGVWGGDRRQYAAIKFFLYTLLGSVGILVGMIALYLLSRDGGGVGTFDLVALASPAMQDRLHHAMGGATGWVAKTLMIATAVGLLVKLPAVPFHTWLPDAHVEAPTPISMLLAAVLLKLGGYGLFRIVLPIFPDAVRSMWWLFALIGVVGIVYGALCALSQTHFKRLVAYSSVSHMGFVVLAAGMMTPVAINGGVFVMVAHGMTSAALFFLVGGLYDRTHDYSLNKFGGLLYVMPVYGGLSAVSLFASLGLPGLCGFIGEVLVLIGSFSATRIDSALMTSGASPAAVYTFATIACFGVVLAAAYSLTAFQRVFFGRPRAELATLADATRTEIAVFVPLVALMILLGLLPWPTVLTFTSPTAEAIGKLLLR